MKTANMSVSNRNWLFGAATLYRAMEYRSIFQHWKVLHYGLIYWWDCYTSNAFWLLFLLHICTGSCSHMTDLQCWNTIHQVPQHSLWCALHWMIATLIKYCRYGNNQCCGNYCLQVVDYAYNYLGIVNINSYYSYCDFIRNELQLQLLACNYTYIAITAECMYF